MTEKYSRYMEHDGARIHYLDVGQGPAILFGHSYLWDHRMWEAQIKVLSKKYRCIVPDLWGHGKSSALPDSYNSLEDLAHSYHKFMSNMGINKYVIVGLSVGGMWGAYLASLYSDKVQGLIIMDSYLSEEKENTKQQYNTLLDAAKNGFSTSLAKNVATMFFRSDNPDLKLLRSFENSLIAFDKHTQIPSILKLGEMIFNRPNFMYTIIDAKNSGIDIEIIVGEKDIPRPMSEAQEMAILVNKDALVIKDAGHIPTVEQPKETTEVLGNILDKMVIIHDEL